jgi:hypothetical protein
VDGLLYPYLTIRGQIDGTLTNYGLMHKDHLEQHHPIRFNQINMTEHCIATAKKWSADASI